MANALVSALTAIGGSVDPSNCEGLHRLGYAMVILAAASLMNGASRCAAMALLSLQLSP